MDSPSPTSSPRRTHFDLSHSAPISFLDAFGRETTFLDEPSFRHKAEVIKYFDGNVDLPAESPEEFLTVLQAVLVATNAGEELELEVDRVKDGVRRNFLELYEANQATLQETEHPVHEIVRPMVADQEEFGHPEYLPRRSDLMEWEISGYLRHGGSQVIEKYIAEEDAVNPCDHPEEFYQLYAAILRNCPKGSPYRLKSQEGLRSQFDALYEANQQGLGKCWAEVDSRRVGEIEQLRSTPFVTSFRAPPMRQYPSSDPYSMHHTTPILPTSSSFLTLPMENFSSLETRLGPFDFEEHGLEEYREEIIGFYNGRPEPRPGFSANYPYNQPRFYEVLKAVFTQLKAIDVSLDESIETEVKQGFIEIFDFALMLEDGEPGHLSESQISEIIALVGTKRRRVRFAAYSMGMEPPRPFMLMGPRENFTDLEERLGPFDFEAHGLSNISERIIEFYHAAPTMHAHQGTRGFSSGSSLSAPSWFPVGERDLFTVLCRVFTQLQPQQSSGLRLETVESVVRSRFLEIFRYVAQVDEHQGGLTTQQVLQINRFLGRTEVVMGPTSRPFTLTSSGLGNLPKGKTPPSGGGNGGNRFVQIALLLLVAYLGYRFVAKPAWQWYRGNKTTPVGE
ncbi:MAG: hypothetical protein H7A41_07210 [Chlamydiales bacterium]|nr:hypothetical protein [Chlamydiales bacterium]